MKAYDEKVGVFTNSIILVNGFCYKQDVATKEVQVGQERHGESL